MVESVASLRRVDFDVERVAFTVVSHGHEETVRQCVPTEGDIDAVATPVIQLAPLDVRRRAHGFSLRSFATTHRTDRQRRTHRGGA
jgi:hypothetical protein